MSKSANPNVRLSANSSMIITGARDHDSKSRDHDARSRDTGQDGVRSRTRLENTYRMEPTKKFLDLAVETVIKDVLESAFEGKTYDAQESPKACAALANQLKSKVRPLVPPRYKIVTFVVVGEEHLATLNLTSRCVWNAKFDNYAEYSYHNGSIYAVGMVYGVFAE